ncbi:MAG: hypothetical protein AAB430_00640 [Patescibacteria group bacterium]
MKKLTIDLPKEIYNKLKRKLKRGEISKFICEAVKKMLVENKVVIK